MPCDDEIDALHEAIDAHQRAQSEFSAAMHNLAAALASFGSGATSAIECLIDLVEPDPDTDDILGCIQAAFSVVSGEEWVQSAGESVDLEAEDLKSARDDLVEATAEFIHCVTRLAVPPSRSRQ